MAGIPKRIFYVWGAGEKKRRDVNLCMLSWKREMPDFEIIEINENSVEYFNFQEELKKNAYFRAVYERKMYACAADYIRLKVLYEYGGIYLDTDVFALKSLDKFLNEPAFVGIQGNTQDTDYDWVEPAILGAKAGNPFIKEVLDFYENEIMKLSDAMRAFNERQDELVSTREDGGRSEPVLRYVEGGSLNSIWAVPSLGINPANGREVYVKQDGTTTYTWDAADQRICGNSLEKYRGSRDIYTFRSRDEAEQYLERERKRKMG